MSSDLAIINDEPITPDVVEWNPEQSSVPAVRDSRSGEPVSMIRHERQATALAADPYVGVAAVPFDAKAQAVLASYQEVPDEWIDIRPEGLIYLSHMKARRVLNEAFGFGGWAIVPVGDFRREEKGSRVTLYRTYRLYVNGRYAGEVEASGDYYTTNAAQNYADAAEACQSYALNRLAKNFGIASQCWDKAYGEAWKKKYAAKEKNSRGEMVWVKRGTPVTLGETTDIPFTGAGAAGPQTTPASSAIRSTDPGATPTAPPPTVSVPASGNDAPLIRLARLSQERKNGAAKGGVMAIGEDDSGNKWSFQGPDAIAAAKEAIDARAILRITEYKINGAFRNVMGAEVAS